LSKEIIKKKFDWKTHAIAQETDADEECQRFIPSG